MRSFIWVSSSTLLICTLLLLFFLSQPTRSSSRAYFKLKTEMEEEQNQSLSAEQKRKGIRKDYYASNGNERMQTHLKAESSSLFLKNEQGGIQIIEVMNNLMSFGRDFKNPLHLHYIESKKGIYHYNNATLTADDLIFKHYEMDENEKIEEASDFIAYGSVIEGEVVDAVFSLKDTQVGCSYSGRATTIYFPGEMKIKSPTSEWNSAHHCLNFDKADGVRPRLMISSGHLEADQLVISHNDLGWMVIAKGEVIGRDVAPELEFSAERRVSIQIQKIEGRHQFTSLLAEGPAQIYLPLTHQYFMSKGLLSINHQKGELIAQSMSSPNGTVEAAEQVFFKDLLCGGYANTFQVEYNPLKMQIKNIILRGQVRIRNVFGEQTPSSHLLDQYAIADEVTIDPVQKKMHFRGLNGSRVLFLDSANRMQMSAGALDVTYDKLMKLPVVKGVGDVRLIFGEEELGKMKKWMDHSENSEPK